MQMKPQTSEHVNVGIYSLLLIWTDTAMRSSLGLLPSAIYREWEARQQLAEDWEAEFGEAVKCWNV